MSSDLIEGLRERGKGSFPCPSCGATASDIYPPPYCPRGCTDQQIGAALARRPPPCIEHGGVPHRMCVACRLLEKYADREATRMLTDTATSYTLPESVNLADLLAEPDEPTPFLVEGLWPVDGHVVLSGPAKAGKTTLRNNLIRSLVDGTPFLGTFDVAEPAQRVALLDLELTRNSLRSWLRRQSIDNPSRVDVYSMRGQAHTLNVFSSRWCDLWADRLRGADVVILDCLEPVLHALRLDPNTEARKFLEEWGAMLTGAGVAGSLVLHHHGHGGERAKGDSGILAWPDALWNLVCQTPGDMASPRYFNAYGRDVEVPESRLDLDGSRLLYVGGSSRDADRGQQDAASNEDRLLVALRQDHAARVADGEEPPIPTCSVQWPSQGAVEAVGKSAGLSRDGTRAAVRRLADRDLLITSKGGSSHATIYALSSAGLGS
jgi:hypothetical protein